MTRRSFTRPRAEQDIREVFRHLAREAGLPIANRFHDSLRVEIAGLLERPGQGSRVGIRGLRLSDLRRWHVSGFQRTLILYRPTDYGIEVVRVLHGARNIARILGRER